jgi:hypothetical protein
MHSQHFQSTWQRGLLQSLTNPREDMKAFRVEIQLKNNEVGESQEIQTEPRHYLPYVLK